MRTVKSVTEEKAKILNNKRKSKVSIKAIVFIAVICVLFVAAAVLISHFSDTPDRNNKEDAREIVETTTPVQQGAKPTAAASYSKGFPVSFSSNSIKDIAVIGSDIFVLTADTISKVSSSGAFESPQVLNYVEPVIKSCGNFGLVFDRMTGKFVVFNGKKTLYTGQSENEQQIITADIADNGNFAIASRGTDSASLLTYYNKSGEVLFSWACSKEHIVSVDINSNKKDIVCAALNAENGEILTRLYLLNIYKTDTEWEYSLNGSAAIECFFASSDNKVVAVCTDKRLILNTNKDEQEPKACEYPSTVLNCKSDENANTVIVTSKFGSFDSYEVTLYSDSNKAEYTFETDERIIDVACVGKHSYLLTDKSIIRVGSSGKGSVVADLNDIELGLDVMNGDIYHYSLGYLFKN